MRSTLTNNVNRDIQSVTTFRRDTAGIIKRMKRTGRPLVLTVNGRAEAVVMDATAYRMLVDQVDGVEGVRRGLVEARKGLGRPVDEVFDDIEKSSTVRRA